MKSRMTLIFAALVTILGTLVLIVQDRHTSVAAVTGNVAAAPEMTALTVSPQPFPEPIAKEAANSLAVGATTMPAASAVISGIEKFDSPAAPMVRVSADGKLQYIARPGDTVSQLAIALLGTDTKANRAAVIAANDSLQANPDRVLAGSIYSIAPNDNQQADAAPIENSDTVGSKSDVTKTKSADASSADSTDAASKATVESKMAQVQPSAKDTLADANGPQMKYTARPGDTVGVLAANLLGGDTKSNRDLIIASNPSLQADPDHLEAGKSYTIVAANGLAKSSVASKVVRSSDHPDADEVAQLSVAPTLRYTAQPGDTVTKLATVLLGSDSAENRKLILEANPSLKRDPDHLVAGKTYWITAPSADTMR